MLPSMAKQLSLPEACAIGTRFGRLVVLGAAPSTPKGPRVYVRCDCGTEKSVARSHLLASMKSCGPTCGLRSLRPPEWAGYRRQRYAAEVRGIPFRFTFEDWSAWWDAELVKLGPGAERGRRRHQYGMARFGDAGAYEPGNVRALTPHENHNDRSAELKRVANAKRDVTATARGIRPIGSYWKGKVGDAYPTSRPVITPRGRFGSIKLAADAFGVRRQTVWKKAAAGMRGYWFEDSAPRQLTLPL